MHPSTNLFCICSYSIRLLLLSDLQKPVPDLGVLTSLLQCENYLMALWTSGANYSKLTPNRKIIFSVLLSGLIHPLVAYHRLELTFAENGIHYVVQGVCSSFRVHGCN